MCSAAIPKRFANHQLSQNLQIIFTELEISGCRREFFDEYTIFLGANP